MWAFDRKNGKGLFYNAATRAKYDGDWKENLKHGFGI